MWNPLRARRERDTRRIAAVFLALPDDHHYGWDLSRKAGVNSGSMYPILTRMVADCWLRDGWDDLPEDQPQRRYYSITVLGQHEMTALLRATP
jgi:PadR family transcriptional regulator PadR